MKVMMTYDEPIEIVFDWEGTTPTLALQTNAKKLLDLVATEAISKGHTVGSVKEINASTI